MKYVDNSGQYTEITTPIGRMSWLYIHNEDPKQKEGDDKKHKLTIMLPKNAKALESLGVNKKQAQAMLKEVEIFKKEFEAEAMEVGKARFKNKVLGTRWNPLLDGDDPKVLASFEGNANFYIIRAKTKFMPTVIDKNKNPIETDDCPEGIYSGCWGRVKLSLYAYGVDGNNGVGAGLGFFIKKIANDAQFPTGGGGGGNADSAFDDDDLDEVGSLDDTSVDDDAFDDDDDEGLD